MKEICLINPPLDKKTTSKFPMSGVPLGIACLAAYLREKKIEVAVIDAPIKGYDIEKTAKAALNSGAKIIGISCLTENRYSAIKTLREIKRLDKSTVTIIGGLHATFSDKLLLENYKFIDIVVRGEGEETLLELIKGIRNKNHLDKILGISFRKDGKIISNPPRPFIKDIETLPFPAYDLFPMASYPLPPDIKGVKQSSLITTSRGCPMGCKFCETTMAWGRGIRSTSAERLFDEVKHLYEKFGIDYIRFADDLFTLKKEKVIKFCNLVIKNKLPIKFRIQARVDTVDEEMLNTLKKAGCDLIEYGAESGSNKILKVIGKNITTEKIKKAVELTRKAGIGVKYFLIVGLLEEGPNETWETFKLIKETKPDWIGINALTIYPGTEVYDIAKKEGLINDDLWINYINPKTGNAPLYTKNYSAKEMIFLAQLGHVWSCRNSPKKDEYPKLERMLSIMLTENLARTLVKNNNVRKICANVAAILSPLLP
jgi:radical SAM superfamily enzyme YgiQ (UPF0313 family)